MSKMNRRNVLRGMVGGSAVTVGLPFLDCFLDTNGTALANGADLPVCFGTWAAGLGFNPGHWEPKIIGPKFENNEQLKVLDPFRDKINIFSGMKVFLDGKPMSPHNTGYQVGTMGAIQTQADSYPSIDSLVADAIGTRTRFRSLEVSCDGSPTSYSRRSISAVNPSEVSPITLYNRIFGPEFKDPNAADFTPDPALMVKRSALSAVSEERADFLQGLGATDKARLDEYFTSLRQLEQQLDISLQKPAPLASCSVPTQLKEEATLGPVIDDAIANGKLFSRLLAHALACGQTRVINMVLPAVTLRQAGSSMTFHMYTHEEGVDEKLGYQPNVAKMQARALDGFVDMLTTMDGFKEGDRTLLDRMLVYYFHDHGYARTHTLDNLPIITAGRANGRVKTGIHYQAIGEPITRVGLTIQQALGVPTNSWGVQSNGTTKTITEIMA